MAPVYGRRGPTTWYKLDISAEEEDRLLNQGDRFTFIPDKTNSGFHVRIQFREGIGRHRVVLRQGDPVGPGYLQSGNEYELEWNRELGAFVVIKDVNGILTVTEPCDIFDGLGRLSPVIREPVQATFTFPDISLLPAWFSSEVYPPIDRPAAQATFSAPEMTLRNWGQFPVQATISVPDITLTVTIEYVTYGPHPPNFGDLYQNAAQATFGVIDPAITLTSTIEYVTYGPHPPNFGDLYQNAVQGKHDVIESIELRVVIAYITTGPHPPNFGDLYQNAVQATFTAPTIELRTV